MCVCVCVCGHDSFHVSAQRDQRGRTVKNKKVHLRHNRETERRPSCSDAETHWNSVIIDQSQATICWLQASLNPLNGCDISALTCLNKRLEWQHYHTCFQQRSDQTNAQNRNLHCRSFNDVLKVVRGTITLPEAWFIFTQSSIMMCFPLPTARDWWMLASIPPTMIVLIRKKEFRVKRVRK